MNDYYEVEFRLGEPSEDLCDILSYNLGEAEYESFEVLDEGAGLKAYVPAAKYTEHAVLAAIDDLPFGKDKVSFEARFVEGQDWNAEWEKHYFQPIVIDGMVTVHSSFHKNVPAAEYDIVIDPKMAFGTGHHATTTLMCRSILALGSLEGKHVVDMGTGTGILAILCAMRGAAEVSAIEIDAFAVENARENLSLNNASEVVTAIHGDASALEALGSGSVDLFLANINRNIICADLGAYAQVLRRPGATVLLSGFYTQDVEIIAAAAKAQGLEIVETRVMDNWCCLRLKAI